MVARKSECMFSNLAVVVFSLTMAVVPASSSVPEKAQIQVDRIEKMQEYASLSTPKLPTVELEIEQIRRAPEPIAAPVNLDSWFRKYADEFGVDESLLKKIAKCESGFNPTAGSGQVPSAGSYGGMFQYAASTWSSTRQQMDLDPNPDLRFNAEESIKTSAFKISRGGQSSWPVCSL